MKIALKNVSMENMQQDAGKQGKHSNGLEEKGKMDS
jgi:hypothetical protein